MNGLPLPPKMVIVDLEATCWETRATIEQMETIEIGAVLVDLTLGRVVDEWQSFVRPMRNPRLSDFCKKLTTITQADVDNADYWVEVYPRFQAWVASSGASHWGSWGEYDRKQIDVDCQRVGLEPGLPEHHVNLKKLYRQIRRPRLPRTVGMARALALEGIKADGQHHRGIYDARNIAMIMLAMKRRKREEFGGTARRETIAVSSANKPPGTR